jgi:hypothetical protein
MRASNCGGSFCFAGVDAADFDFVAAGYFAL